MVEDIRLQVFIRYPGCGCREEIQFQRYTVIGRLKLAHHASHIMIHPPDGSSGNNSDRHGRHQDSSGDDHSQGWSYRYDVLHYTP